MFKKIINVLLFLLLHISFSKAYSQEHYLIVKDSITKETLPYTSINLQNGYGLFTDENGKVTLDKDIPKTIKITHIGYSSRMVSIDTLIDNVVLLQPETNVLNEMKIPVTRKDLKKRKEYVVKPSLHDNIDEMYWSSIGQQFAFYIPNEKGNGVLKSVTIPLIVKDLYQGMADSSFEEHPYGTMVRFEFMSNSDKLPGAKLYGCDKVFVIQSDKVSQKVEVKFEESIPVPDEGFFVVMTVIGKTNEKGEYVPEMPYGVREVHGEKKKFIKIILPNYPLVEAPKGPLTLFRHVFDSSEKWRKIDRPMVYKKGKEYPVYNIGIGYVISAY
ncbi:peptidase associated/transthyretin-like domain-containing protein [Flavobacterium limnosediminis]|nr:hypothetical protein [Flavobacterium limnosediminis]